MSKVDMVNEGIGMHATVQAAMMLALKEMRRELRWMMEVMAEATRDTPPKPDNLDAAERRMVDEVLDAIRACGHCTGGDMPADDQPEWLDDVIHGRLKV